MVVWFEPPEQNTFNRHWRGLWVSSEALNTVLQKDIALGGILIDGGRECWNLIGTVTAKGHHLHRFRSLETHFVSPCAL